MFFKQDRKKRNRFVKVVADLGVRNDQWAEVLSGVRLNDQVITQGAYVMMLATQSNDQGLPPGYHVHADGSIHGPDDH